MLKEPFAVYDRIYRPVCVRAYGAYHRAGYAVSEYEGKRNTQVYHCFGKCSPLGLFIMACSAYHGECGDPYVLYQSHHYEQAGKPAAYVFSVAYGSRVDAHEWQQKHIHAGVDGKDQNEV